MKINTKSYTHICFLNQDSIRLKDLLQFTGFRAWYLLPLSIADNLIDRE